MSALQFTTTINAPREKVWSVLWNKPDYEYWTAVFQEGSTIETDNYRIGSKVIFGDGKGNGMLSKVADNRAPEFMSFEHLGEIKDGVEDTTSERVQAWRPAFENYTLTEENGKTTLVVDLQMQLNEEFKNYFAGVWPGAMERIKELGEKA